MDETTNTSIKSQIVDEAKKSGLDIAEDAVAAVWVSSIDLATKYCSQSSNGILKLVGTILPLIKSPVLKWIDKIDGEDDGR